MAEAVHMSLRDRKAYALLSSYTHAVRTVVPNGSAELNALSNAVKTLADDVADQAVPNGPQGPLDQFLVGAVDQAKAMVAGRLGTNPIPTVATRVLKAWKADVHRFKCSNCTKGPICNGLDADDAIVAARGHCIEAIKAAIADARRLTDGAYRKYVPKVPLPDLVFRTTALSEPPAGIPVQGLAVNGMTTYHDEAGGKISEIDLRVATTAISRVAMASLPYMLMHEVFCHGYQMMTLGGARPNRDDMPDPLSEGMADAAAMVLLEREAKRLGARRGSVHQANLKMARHIHEARANRDLEPMFSEAPWVWQGIQVAEKVEHFYRGEGSPDQAAEDTLALTVALNAAGWGFANRIRGLAKILKGLTSCPRDWRLMDLLLEFRKKRTVAALVDHLTRN